MLSAGRVHVHQQATATGASVVIQVGGDLYLSDASLSAAWVPREATPGECPFPGLDAFGPGQAKWFFGRDKLTGDLLEALDDVLRTGSGGPVLVVGPSGAGKSSLLGAGLMAALAQGRLAAAGSASWPRVMFTPGARPLATLREALATCARARAGTDAGRAAIAADTAALDGSALDADSPAVIVVDQFEEIWTACGDDTERSGFLDELAGLAAAGGRGTRGDRPAAVVVLGLRADFYARATAYPVLRAAMGARQVVLGAMSAAEVRNAIIRPARDAGLTLDDGLAERLMRDLGVDEVSGYEPGRLPLLAHALRATWQRRDGDRLTVAGYEATGGIGGAIARTAEGVYAALDDVGQSAARQVFLALVRVGEAASDSDGEGTADTRRRVSAESLYERAPDEAATRAVVAEFTAARLLASGGEAVQITHEALLVRWPRLREWIDEDRAGNLVRQGLEEAAASWDHEGRDPAGLYGGARLAAAQERASDPGRAAELSRIARDFLAASGRRRRRGVRRRNAIIAVLAALSLALGGVAGFAFKQRSDAQESARLSESAALALESNAVAAANNPGPAMSFAVVGWRLDRTSQLAASALLSTQAAPYTGRLTPPDHQIYGVAFSPGGALIATAGSSGFVRLWSAASYRQLTAVHAAPSNFPAYAVAFSPDGRTLAVGQLGGVGLWRVTRPTRLVPAGFLPTDAGNDNHVNKIAFGPGGRSIAVTDSAGYAQLWDLPSRTLLEQMATTGPADGIAFAAGRRVLAVGLVSGAVELWDLDRHEVSVIQPAAKDLNQGSVAVSPDGQTIAFAANAPSGTAPSVKLWSPASHQVTRTVTSPDTNDGVSALAFSPDGRLLAVGGLDDVVRLWDLRAESEPVLFGTFSGHTSPIADLAFSPDGSTLVAASYDGTVSMWDVRGSTLDGGSYPALTTVFSPDGRLLAVGGEQEVHLFSMPSRKLVAILHTARLVSAIAFSRDGRTLAAAIEDKPRYTLQLWDVSTRRLMRQIPTHQQQLVEGLAFSPGGRLVAVSSPADPIVRVFNTANLSQAAALDTAPDRLAYGVVALGNWAVAFSPDGRLLATAGNDGLTLLWNVATWTLAQIDDQVGTQATSVTFSPDGGTVAMGAEDGTVYLYKVQPRSKPFNLTAAASTPADFTPATGFLSGSSQLIKRVEYAPGGQLIATGLDGTIRLWNVARQSLVWSISTGAGQFWAMSYSAALHMVATADGHVTRVWLTDPSQVAADICRTMRIPPGVGKNAWSTYLPGLTYIPTCP